jgi:hypothetical protein
MPLDFLTLMTVMAANLFMISAAFKLARGMLGAFTDQYPSFHAPHPVNLAAHVATNVSLVLGTVSLLVAWRTEAEHKLRTLAMTDGLTGVFNRRGFTTQGSSLLAHAARHQWPMTALMLDLDHFKQVNEVNDPHGHEAGDRALQLFARLLGETCRSGDLIGRLGGRGVWRTAAAQQCTRRPGAGPAAAQAPACRQRGRAGLYAGLQRRDGRAAARWGGPGGTDGPCRWRPLWSQDGRPGAAGRG